MIKVFLLTLSIMGCGMIDDDSSNPTPATNTSTVKTTDTTNTYKRTLSTVVGIKFRYWLYPTPMRRLDVRVAASIQNAFERAVVAYNLGDFAEPPEECNDDNAIVSDFSTLFDPVVELYDIQPGDRVAVRACILYNGGGFSAGKTKIYQVREVE